MAKTRTAMTTRPIERHRRHLERRPTWLDCIARPFVPAMAPLPLFGMILP